MLLFRRSIAVQRRHGPPRLEDSQGLALAVFASAIGIFAAVAYLVADTPAFVTIAISTALAFGARAAADRQLQRTGL